jgi:hypothetical protein
MTVKEKIEVANHVKYLTKYGFINNLDGTGTNSGFAVRNR